MLHFILRISKSILHQYQKIGKRHSCINNPLKSSEGLEILTKELAGTSFLQQQLWQQRENVFEFSYKSHNTATTLHIQA